VTFSISVTYIQPYSLIYSCYTGFWKSLTVWASFFFVCSFLGLCFTSRRAEAQSVLAPALHCMQQTSGTMDCVCAVNQMRSNTLIDNNIRNSSLFFTLSACICPLKSNLTAPQPLWFMSVRPSTYLPVLLSFPCLFWQFHHPPLSVCLSVCPALAVLTAPRSHAVAVFCSVMATGATHALSHPTDR